MAFGNPSYGLGDGTAVAIEYRLTQEWKHQWTSLCALLAFIKMKDGNFNKGANVSNRGAILPIIGAGPTTPAAGVADASELTPDTLDVTNGLTQAFYNWTHYRKSITLRESEQRLLIPGYRGNLLEGKIQQMTASFRESQAADVEGTATDSRTNMLGVEYALGAANVVGGIDQSDSNNTWWRGGRNNVGGAMSLLNLDFSKHRISTRANGSGKPYKPDLLLCSYNSTIDTYGRIHSLIAPAERIVNANFEAKFGFENINYRGMMAVMSQRITSGTIQMLSTESFYYYGYDQPKNTAVTPIPGTDAWVRTYTLWSLLACDSPRVNELLYGITG